MKYSVLGKTGLKVSRLGFGCMRLPMTAAGQVNRELTIPLLHRAVDLGINYFDTGILYCRGDSQRTLGEAFQAMRDRVILSTKNHIHAAADDTWWAQLENSLAYLRTDYLDIYNLHSLDWATWIRNIDGPSGKYRLLQKAKDQGLIRHICCSCHDSAEGILKLLETGAFESFTLQYNLLNRELEQVLFRAKELNIGIVVMGPVGGGQLGVDSARIHAMTGGNVTSTPEAALRFVLAQPSVHIALSGMNTLQMLEQNVMIVSTKAPFTTVQIAAMDDEVQRVKQSMGVNCPACGYCQPCPFGVNIPGNFAVYNKYCIYGLRANAVQAYARLNQRAAACTECGVCLPKCPQKIKIPEILRKVMLALDEDFKDFGSLLALTGITPQGDLQAQVTVKNIGNTLIAPNVTLMFEQAIHSHPETLQIAEVAPMSAVARTVTIPVPEGASMLKGTLVTVHANETRTTNICLPFLIAPRDHLRWHVPHLLPEHFAGREDILASHHYRVGLRHDSDKIHIELDIKSQLLALAPVGTTNGGRFELYVDMRPQEQGGQCAPYSDGAEHFLLALGEPGHGTKSNKHYTLNQRNTPTDGGVYVTFDLLFAEFLKPGWKLPPRIGLDFMFVVTRSDGEELGRPTYSSRRGLGQNPALLTPAYLP